MRPSFKTHCDKALKRESSHCDKVHKHEPKSHLPRVLIDFVKHGIIAISRNLLSIGADTSREDGGKNRNAVASNPATGKEKLYPDMDVDKELNAG
ncbi:hypothetical protein DFQ27_002159, partial [Actinomortierella ambigua]